MSLFRKLQRLYRPEKFQFEDFHTEIVAQVLKNSPALTLAWLRSIKATSLDEADHIKVSTQETFQPLAHHPTASRPDITIRLSVDTKAELIVIESKQSSTQDSTSSSVTVSICSQRNKTKSFKRFRWCLLRATTR